MYDTILTIRIVTVTKRIVRILHKLKYKIEFIKHSRMNSIITTMDNKLKTMDNKLKTDDNKVKIIVKKRKMVIKKSKKMDEPIKSDEPIDTGKVDQVSLYLKSLTIQENQTLEIASSHLGTSFNIKRSIGFLNWKSNQNQH